MAEDCSAAISFALRRYLLQETEFFKNNVIQVNLRKDIANCYANWRKNSVSRSINFQGGNYIYLSNDF